ncbi:hypothetical protein MC7420_8042 [Coleofasciculus chthonoplastes PCC 7420]|uniref:Uncharacterized protein n=1 Tax=Coleofasciculus chthonoplastes PCC 7420 TaxID=118168 RepID=B4VIR3_9CYAN|nr:hypothetical protein MC7420_8042 [Coleofasciculus chthonoplastes PCC 7420]
MSIYSSTFPPHPLTPSPTVGRRGIGGSCSPLAPLSRATKAKHPLSSPLAKKAKHP